jgi:hypothetical protein
MRYLPSLIILGKFNSTVTTHPTFLSDFHQQTSSYNPVMHILADALT